MVTIIIFGQVEPIIETYLEAIGFWKAAQENYPVVPLPDNPTVAQIRNGKESKARNVQAKARIFFAIEQQNSLGSALGI